MAVATSIQRASLTLLSLLAHGRTKLLIVASPTFVFVAAPTHSNKPTTAANTQTTLFDRVVNGLPSCCGLNQFFELMSLNTSMSKACSPEGGERDWLEQ
jgi:hypothetical protein